MEPVVQLRGAVTLLGRFPALAGIDLEVAAGEVRAAPRPERRRQDHPAALLRRPGAAGPRRGPGARPRPHRPPPGPGAAPPRGPPRARHRPLRRAHRGRQRAVLGPGRRRPRRGRRRRPRRLRARRAAGRTSPWPGSRPASAAAPRWPAWWPADPSCGCSTSRTPGSTTRAATCSTTSCAGPKAAGATVVLASHELDRAEALADRVVTIAGGTIAGPAPPHADHRGAGPCSVTPPSWRARTCGSSCARRSPPSRSRRSPSSC